MYGMPNPQILIEELDGLPIILSLLKKMDIISLIDNIFIPHKNWCFLPFNIDQVGP